MLIQVNGEQRDVPDSVTLAGLVRHLSLAPERLAIELNQRVVRRPDWPETTLKEGDRVEIVHFVGGGI
ncbi:MAG TPA: sulfur carrier protein ThiS [Pyrinomonadaceae bacterium]|nr:sulfur carrier protein ThiS [Pyrinomonadaceae bacterium]